jgi:hypothetical protein
MCQHGMVSKGFWKNSSLDFTFMLQTKGINGFSQDLGHHYLALGNCGKRRSFF